MDDKGSIYDRQYNMLDFMREHQIKAPEIQIDVSGGKNMENNNYKERVEEERYDLIDKIKQLKKFMKSKEANSLSIFEKDLLKSQLNTMKTYKHLLDARLDWM